ncbi:MAG: response regulator transcription factor [Anaerolineales bacterium]
MQNGFPAKVLIIDDDQALCDSLSLLLEPQDFIVYSTTSGAEGIQLCRELQPDVVLLDILMPAVDGWEVARQIRTFSHVPIVVLSAVSKPEMIARALDEGFDDYLVKPISGNVLAAHLKRITQRARLNPIARVA